jgi:hypothetical protein
MGRLTESVIEEFAIKLFERLGYGAVYAPDIAPRWRSSVHLVAGHGNRTEAGRDDRQ